MNEKLTPKQRDWILADVIVPFAGASTNWDGISEALDHITALTEDECPRCKGKMTWFDAGGWVCKNPHAAEDDFEANLEALNELVDELNTAKDEPTCYLVKCDWKTAYLELAKMVDKQLTTHTEPEDENQITLWKWKEYEHWLGEWNGDEPAPQEHITFEDWLQEASDE